MTRLILCVIALIACVAARAEHNPGGGGTARPIDNSAGLSADEYKAVDRELEKELAAVANGLREAAGQTPHSVLGEQPPLRPEAVLSQTNYSTVRLPPPVK